MRECPDFRVAFNGLKYRIERKRPWIFLFSSGVDWSPLGRRFLGRFVVEKFDTLDEAEKMMCKCQDELDAERRGWQPVKKDDKENGHGS